MSPDVAINDLGEDALYCDFPRSVAGRLYNNAENNVRPAVKSHRQGLPNSFEHISLSSGV
jgi:hypothetical protein